mmetsp:Transcript_66545/g.100283  ORF Transcript_66545/g.100283 Transcript_66545/m.100283 type:complete len:250 (-) Transcript_66545:77-826(-)
MAEEQGAAGAGEEKTSPLKIVEERIYFIQGCLDEDPENEGLYNKHEEYFDLYDQLQEVSKKLRRVEKQLAQQPSTKLEKKRLQYIRHVEETVQYVLNDEFFLPPEAQEERTTMDLRNCLVRVSSCLGQPLESIIEMPGMEGSERTLLSTKNLPGMASMGTGSSSSLSAGMQSSISRLQASAEKGLELVEEGNEDGDDEPLVSPFTMRGRKNLRMLEKPNENDGLHMSDDDLEFNAADSDEESLSDDEKK